jgi:hypothetical protein
MGGLPASLGSTPITALLRYYGRCDSSVGSLPDRGLPDSWLHPSAAALSQLQMTLGHVRASARAIQRRLRGRFYGDVDRVRSDSAHQRGNKGALQGDDLGPTGQEFSRRLFSP